MWLSTGGASWPLERLPDGYSSIGRMRWQRDGRQSGNHKPISAVWKGLSDLIASCSPSGRRC